MDDGIFGVYGKSCEMEVSFKMSKPHLALVKELHCHGYNMIFLVEVATWHNI